VIERVEGFGPGSRPRGCFESAKRRVTPARPGPQTKKKKRRVSTDYSDFTDSRQVLVIIFLICVICEIGGYSSSGFERVHKFFEMLDVSSTEHRETENTGEEKRFLHNSFSGHISPRPRWFR